MLKVKLCKTNVNRSMRLLSQLVVPDNSFALSGSGWLMPFYLGVIDGLRKEGIMNETSHYAGSSGGSICALHACSDYSCEEALGEIIEMSTNKIVWKNMDSALRKSLIKRVTPEALEKCQGRLHVTTTKVWPNPEAKATIFSKYDSAEHMVDCIAASCFIPLYGASQLSVNIGQEKHIDGGVFAFIPPVGKVTISPFGNTHFRVGGPPNMRPIDIHLDKEEFPLGKLLYWALNPAPEEKMHLLYKRGEEAALRWVEQQEHRPA